MTPSTRDPRDPQYQRYLRAVAGAQRVLQERQVVENLESGQTVQLYLCYIGDGYLYGVSDNDAARSPSYWAGVDEGMDIVQATFPAAIAQDLLSFTNSEASSSVGDGYEAADLAAKHMQNDTVIYSSKGEAEDGMMESARVAQSPAPRWNESLTHVQQQLSSIDPAEFEARMNAAKNFKQLSAVLDDYGIDINLSKQGDTYQWQIAGAPKMSANGRGFQKARTSITSQLKRDMVPSGARVNEDGDRLSGDDPSSLQESVEGSSLLIKEVARDLISMSVADALERENHDALSDFVRSQEDITETVPIGLQEHGIDIDSYIAPVEELVRQIAEQIGSENLGKLQDVDDRALWLVIMGPILNHGVGPTDDPALATVYKEVGSPRPQVKGLDVTLFNVAEDIISRISNGTSMLQESTEGKVARSYVIHDHGIDHAQYFRGHGLAHSDMEDTATGAGDTFEDALEDALDQLASDDWDLSQIESAIATEAASAGASSSAVEELKTQIRDEILAENPEFIDPETDDVYEDKADELEGMIEDVLQDEGGDLYYYVSVDVSTQPAGGGIRESTEGNNRWEVIWLDVWGNAEEGFEVNDAHHTGRFVELPPEVAMGITEEEEQQLVDILIAAGELRRDVKAHQIEVEDLGENDIGINDAETREPLFQLQRVVETQSAEKAGEKVQEKLARQVMEIRMLAGGKFGIFDKSMRGAEPLAKANSWHEARMKINSMMRDAQKPLKD